MKATERKHAKTVRSKKARMAQHNGTSEKDRFGHLNPRLAGLARKQWPEEGRAERIERAQEAWRAAQQVGSSFKKLDIETIKWIAEDPDLEYL